jgi:Inner membrane component of T3SS, cytoplasmic domain
MRLWLAFVVVALLVVRGHADENKVVLDRIEHEPSTLGGNRLRVFVSAHSYLGGMLDLTAEKAIKLQAGGSEIKAPYAVGRYVGVDAQTAIVVLVEATQPYAEILPVIADGLDAQLFAALDEHQTQVAIIAYGETVQAAKLQPIKSARAKVSQIQNDGTATDPLLLEAVERALALLKKAKGQPEGAPLRKMIVIVGDGRDLSNDRDRVSRLGERAAREGVRIHSLAFAPNDIRKPLFLLGELGKKSLGTFRWVRQPNADSWASSIQQLREEINQQYVITYFLPSDTEVAGRKVKVVTSAGTSANELKVPAATCAGVTCAAGQYCTGTVCIKPKGPEGRGVFGWILIIGSILVGGILLLAVAGFVITKRQQAQVPMDPDALIAAAQAKAMKSKPPPAPPKPASVPPQAFPSQPPQVAAPVSGPRLYIMSGPRTGEEIALKHGFMVGKQPGCDLVIEDGFTSSQHAQFGVDHFGNARLYDRGSTNGTYVNGVRVTEYVLEHGMTIRIGSTDLRFLAQ